MIKYDIKKYFSAAEDGGGNICRREPREEYWVGKEKRYGEMNHFPNFPAMEWSSSFIQAWDHGSNYY